MLNKDITIDWVINFGGEFLAIKFIHPFTVQILGTTLEVDDCMSMIVPFSSMHAG